MNGQYEQNSITTNHHSVHLQISSGITIRQEKVKKKKKKKPCVRPTETGPHITQDGFPFNNIARDRFCRTRLEPDRRPVSSTPLLKWFPFAFDHGHGVERTPCGAPGRPPASNTARPHASKYWSVDAKAKELHSKSQSCGTYSS